MNKYYAVNHNEPEYIMKKFYYDVEMLSFEDVISVSDALYYRDWSIFKVEDDKFIQMDKHDFVKELELPYTEINID